MMLPSRFLIGLGLGLVFSLLAGAEEKDPKKTETFKGILVCSKCELGETEDCGTAIKTRIEGKEVVIFLLDQGKAEKYHAKICSSPAKGSVTGVVSQKDKKMWITPSKDGVKFD